MAGYLKTGILPESSIRERSIFHVIPFSVKRAGFQLNATISDRFNGSGIAAIQKPAKENARKVYRY